MMKKSNPSSRIPSPARSQKRRCSAVIGAPSSARPSGRGAGCLGGSGCAGLFANAPRRYTDASPGDGDWQEVHIWPRTWRRSLGDLMTPEPAEALRLITIPISHYCEKVRWALERAGMAYREERHVQGVHRLAARRAGGGITVPVLVTPEG